MASLFKRNPDFPAEMNADPEVRRNLAETVEPAREQAERYAAETRIMSRQSQAIAVGEDEDGAVVIANTDYGGHLAEYGSANNPAYAPLRRGVIDAGFDLRESE